MVSKLEPPLLIVTVPLAGAGQLNQTERPPCRPACKGSPASRVAASGLPLALTLPVVDRLNSSASANASFAGAAVPPVVKRKRYEIDIGLSLLSRMPLTRTS